MPADDVIVVVRMTRKEADAYVTANEVFGVVSHRCAVAIRRALARKEQTFDGYMNEGYSVFHREYFHPSRPVTVVPREEA